MAITMREVGPRDGLQSEAQALSVEQRVSLVQDLFSTGLSSIEIGSFVSPRWVPQMRGTDEVFKALSPLHQTQSIVLVPNEKGLEEALTLGVKNIAVFTAASSTFCEKNTHCTLEESLQRLQKVTSRAKAEGLWVRGYISCIMGCPYEGKISPQQVASVVEKLKECDEISLGDTIGVGTVVKVRALLGHIKNLYPVTQLAVHFHDTYGQALANIYGAVLEGVHIIDSAVGGLGGCPYAPGASGNVATEDVIYMLQGMGMIDGVDIKALSQVGAQINEMFGRETRSKAGKALKS